MGESQRDEHADLPPTFTIFPKKPFFVKAGEQWEIVLNVSTNQRRFNPSTDNTSWAPMGTEGIRHYATSKGSFHLEFGEEAANQRGHQWRSCLENRTSSIDLAE